MINPTKQQEETVERLKIENAKIEQKPSIPSVDVCVSFNPFKTKKLEELVEVSKPVEAKRRIPNGVERVRRKYK